MSVINPNETSKSWRTHRREQAVQLYLSGVDGDAAELVGARVGGYPLSLNLVPVTDWIDPEDLGSAAAAVIQVDSDAPASLKRFQKLAASVAVPLIAATFDPPLALVRSLMKSGAHDVVPLPLNIGELESSIAAIGEEQGAAASQAAVAPGRLVTVMKSVGGVGATSVLGQLAIGFAEHEAAAGREACLIDLDVQFGDAAFQLGLQPKLSIAELLGAGSRLDGAMLRATAVKHPSGLNVIAAPQEMMPVEALSSDQLTEIVQLAGREFGTVFIDLPTNWTNWSLSVLAQSDLVLLITELSVTSLNRARRQLDLLQSQDLDLDIRVVVNRFEHGLLRTIRPTDVRKALGRDIGYTVSNDYPLMRSAIEQGVPITRLKRRSSLARELDQLDAGIAAILGLER